MDVFGKIIKSSVSALIGTMAFVVSVEAQWEYAKVYDLPKFTQPPVLDGNRSTVADEWTGSVAVVCAPSVVEADGLEYGWRDENSKWSQISANQLVQSEGEDGATARTDADYWAKIYHAWDDEAVYFFVETRDNVRDVTDGSGGSIYWWERDSISLHFDLLNLDINTPDNETFGNNGYNMINMVAAPQNSSSVTRTYEYIAQSKREFTQLPEDLEGMDYGFRDAGDEFGGEADYTIEAKISWSALIRAGNLPRAPSVGEEMGFSWIGLDPDNDEDYGGQIQCEGWIPEAATFSTWVFSDNPAGPSGATAVEQDSWARIKATFVN